mgnify:CR=1 FL=1
MIPLVCKHGPGAIGLYTNALGRYSNWLICLSALQMPSGSAPIWIVGATITDNTAEIFTRFLSIPQLEWVFLMPDDHTFEPELLMNLLDRNVDVIAPLCLNRAIPIEPSVREFRDGIRQPRPLSAMPLSGTFKLEPDWYVGDAGMLLKRKVIEQTGPPWRGGALTDPAQYACDVYYCKKIQAAGFDVWIDVDNVIGHTGSVTYVPIKTENGWAIDLRTAASNRIGIMKPQEIGR